MVAVRHTQVGSAAPRQRSCQQAGICRVQRLGCVWRCFAGGVFIWWCRPTWLPWERPAAMVVQRCHILCSPATSTSIPGHHRDVYLLLKPRQHIADFHTRTPLEWGPDGQLTSAR